MNQVGGMERFVGLLHGQVNLHLNGLLCHNGVCGPSLGGNSFGGQTPHVGFHRISCKCSTEIRLREGYRTWLMELQQM